MSKWPWSGVISRPWGSCLIQKVFLFLTIVWQWNGFERMWDGALCAVFRGQSSACLLSCFSYSFVVLYMYKYESLCVYWYFLKLKWFIVLCAGAGTPGHVYSRQSCWAVCSVLYFKTQMLLRPLYLDLIVFPARMSLLCLQQLRNISQFPDRKVLYFLLKVSSFALHIQVLSPAGLGLGFLLSSREDLGTFLLALCFFPVPLWENFHCLIKCHEKYKWGFEIAKYWHFSLS